MYFVLLFHLSIYIIYRHVVFLTTTDIIKILFMLIFLTLTILMVDLEGLETKVLLRLWIDSLCTEPVK